MAHTRDDQITRILNPDSVAIAGASDNVNKRGHIALKRLLNSNYDGHVYPVNPSHEGKILGQTVYPSVSAIPDPVDLVYIVTPAGVVPNVLADAGQAGAAGAVIFTAGFSEVGNEEGERQLLRIVESEGIRFIGPNVMGMINLPRDMYLGIDARYSSGGIAVISQSGNLGMTLGRLANQERNLGLSHFVSIGNESDLKFHELLPYFSSDDHTEALVIYSEGMSRGRAFLQKAHTFTRTKPIIALKGGRTRAGQSSARLHTASLAGNADIAEQVYEQAGIIGVDHFDEIIPIAEALTGSPPLSGSNVAVMTEAGGVATISCDALVEHGLNVPELTQETQEKLGELFPDSPNLTNPVDTMVNSKTASLHGDAAETLLSDPNIDGLLICGAYGGYGIGGHGIELPADEESRRAQLESARRMTRLPNQYEKPIIIKSTLTPEDSEALAICRDGGIPVYETFRYAPLAFRALLRYNRFRNSATLRSDFTIDSKQGPHEAIMRAAEQDRDRLSEYEVKEMLQDYGIPVTPYRLASSAEEAVKAASQFEVEVAMKIVSPRIQHKTEAGGVSLGISGDESVAETYQDLVERAEQYDPEAPIDGVLVSPMLEDGLEVIVGTTWDEEVGPVVMFGLGGVFVEVLEDVSFGAVPLTEYDARQMIQNIRGYELINGIRGSAGVDEEALVDLLLTVSRIQVENPNIREFDLNPVFCYEDELSVVDAAIQL